MRLNKKLLVALLIAGIAGAVSCKKEKVGGHEVLTPEQLVSGRMAGTWAVPSNMETPDNVPHELFGNMRLVFTTDDTGTPSGFLAKDCPIVFGNAGSGNWTVTGTQDSAMVKLTGIEPVDEFTVKVTGTSLTLSFYMGWENTDTKVTGKGNFKVTLARQ